MLDFEKSARKALNIVFPKSNIYGYFFRYIKQFWKKSKNNCLQKEIN